MNSLGIVVPMRNEAPHIQRTLCSALHSAAAAGMSCELIVIDNGSTDAGYALAQALGARVISAPGLAVGAGGRHTHGAARCRRYSDRKSVV